MLSIQEAREAAGLPPAFYCDKISGTITEEQCRQRHKISVKGWQSINDVVIQDCVCATCSKYKPQFREKTCPKCGETFPLTEKYWYRRGSRYYPDCKPCTLAYNRHRYEVRKMHKQQRSVQY
jgi:hypothetical protein